MKTINGNVYLNSLKLRELPEILKGIHINGSFNINENYLKTLNNSPESVKKGFYCHHNKHLKSFVGGPKTVGGLYAFSSGLTSLEGFPNIQSGETKTKIDISNCKLTSLKGLPEMCPGTLSIFGNSTLKSLEGCSQYVFGDFEALWLPITSMIGGPRKIYGDCHLFETNIDSLDGIPEYILGNLYIGDTPLWYKLHPVSRTPESIKQSKQLLDKLHSKCDVLGGIYQNKDNDGL